MTKKTSTNPGLGRTFAAGAAAAVAAIVWTHGLAAVLRHFGEAGAPLASISLTLAAVAVAVASTLTWRLGAPLPLAAVAGLAASGVMQVLHPGVFHAALALAAVAPAVAWGGRRLAERLPVEVDRAVGRRRLAAALWAAMALLAVVQTGRLATWITDPAFDWYLSTRHPFWAKHECLPAYVYGAELAARGERNVYDAAHYPGLTPDAEPWTALEGMVVEDPFQYPPQFLLLPRLAIALTHDYAMIRAVWFALQTTFFLAVAGYLAAWIGGRAGRMAAYFLPLALSAFPALHTLQYGQFHLVAIALGVTAYLAFDARRPLLGAAMLAVSILAKVFPFLLLIPLLVEKRWKELGLVFAFGVAITALTFAVFGPAPFVAFFDYHLPRLGNGDAFAFGEAWPEIRELVIADNQGAFGLAAKLTEMGVPGLDARRVARFYGLGVIAFTFFVAFRLRRATREERAAAWLAILGLGSMASTGAFGDYVPVTATWLATLLAWRMSQGRRTAVLLAVCWVFQYFFLGTSPIGEYFSPQVMIPVSVAGVVLMFALFAWPLLAVRVPERSGAEVLSTVTGRPTAMGPA